MRYYNNKCGGGLERESEWTGRESGEKSLAGKIDINFSVSRVII